MQRLAGFETVEERAFYRPSGCVSAGQLADQITLVLKRARAAAVRDVVVDITAMSGFESPGPAYRRWVARRWARALGPEVLLAVVARSEHICPEKTGLLVAAEEGLRACICETEDEAVTWLNSAARGRARVNSTASSKVKTSMIADPDANHIAFAEAVDKSMAR